MPDRPRLRSLALALVAVLVLLVGCSSGGGSGTATGTGGGDGNRATGNDGGGDGGGDGEGGDESTTTEAPRRRFTVAGTGDFLIHTPVQYRANANAGGKGYDFTPMFADVRDVVTAADVAICHAETPISKDNKNLTGYPIFNVPTELAADAAEAGWDGCDTASNHTLDKGFDGLVATLDVLDAAGLKHTGSFRTEEESRQFTIYDVKGVKVGHLAYTYGTNGIPIPAGKAWSINLNDPDKMLADARAIKQAGAEVVVMSVHWGAEYQAKPTPDQQQLARTLLGSPDVDLILGDHVHVVQPFEKIGDKWVIYGMGNFLSNQSPAAGLLPQTQDGLIAQFTFEEQPGGGFKAVKAEYTPTFVNRPDYRIIQVGPQANVDSFKRTAQAVHLLGEPSAEVTATTGDDTPYRPATTTTTTRAPSTTAKPTATTAKPTTTARAR